jgi:hypothetical protein
MQIDLTALVVWIAISVTVIPGAAFSLWAIWRGKEEFRKKMDNSVPIVWNAVQQIIRKAGGQLPEGKKPIDLAIDLLKRFVKLTPKQEAAARIALQAYHESQGHPDAKPGVKDLGSALSENQVQR